MKFLVFIALTISAWYVMGWIQQTMAAGRKLNRQSPADRQTGGQDRTAMRATDTVVCSRCGTYVPADFPTACSRNDCPFPGVG